MLRLFAFLLICQSLAFGQANPIFDELTTKGVVAPKGPAMKLPAPTLADGVDAASQKNAIAGIDAKRKPEDLWKKSVVAPFVLKVTDDAASVAAGGAGRRVDLWFVAYGDLAKIADENFWSKEDAEKDDSGTEGKGQLLKQEDLTKRKITLIEAPGLTDRYSTAEFTLFDRVRLSVTTHSVQTKSDESITFAGLVDPRFASDAEFPNAWRAIKSDDAGKKTLGPPQPYSGAGSYMKATQLKEPAGAILVEYHMAFDEPTGWFNGANLLRSKLPIVVQDNVRKLRRKLEEKAK